MRDALRRLHADAWLERGLVFVIAASLAGLALALAGAFQAWIAWLVAALATAVYHWRAAIAPPSPLALRGVHVAAVLLLALLFRLPPYQYVLGGQDPGVYTNVAAHLLRSGGIAVHDGEFDRLAGTGGAAEYRRNNLATPFVPGVYVEEGGAQPRLSFQFYHLFPVWMALAASLLGIGGAGYGLLALSLLSIACFQRLASELAGSPRVGLVAGLMLAANPLHAFFSKFPVTEVPTLAFSAASFCLLAMYALAPPERRVTRWLWLSAAAMACLFLTRISGFMYLPLVLAVSVAALARDPDRGRARALSAWALAVTGAYALSVAYGLQWSRRYSLDIYGDVFEPLLGLGWQPIVAGLVLGLGTAWAAVWLARERPAVAALAQGIGRLERWMGPALLLLLPLAAYKAWQLGFTDHYAGNETLAQFPGLVAAGWRSVAHTSLVVAAMYLGPLAFVAVLLVAQARLPAAGRLLLFFLCGFFAYAALLNWVEPYQPYYARYLASELVPYALLLLCCALAWLAPGRARQALGGVLALSFAGYLLVSGSQVGKPDNDGALASIGQLAAQAGDGDVILLDGLAVPGLDPAQVKTTLVYTLGRHVVTVAAASLTDFDFMAALQQRYDRVLLASTRGGPPPGWTELPGIALHSRGFERSLLPPHRLVPTMDAQVRVFRLDRLDFGPGFRRAIALDADPRIVGAVGARDIGNGIRARGPSGILLSLPGLALPAGRYRLVLRGVADGRDDAVLSVLDGGQALAQASVQARATPGGALAWLDMDVPPGGARRLDVQVQVAGGSRLLLREAELSRLR